MRTVVIAGSGVSGLACAARLASRVECILVERLPVAGGEHWDEPDMRRLVRAALQAGAHVAAGTQAVRWDGHEVLLLGAENRLQRAHALVVATGHRPMTLGELGVAGERCGGIVPATVAQHLIDNGVRLGEQPVVVGGDARAAWIIEQLAAQDAEVHAVMPTRQERDPRLRAERQYPGAWPIAVKGRLRVSSTRLRWPDGRELQLACDSLILAHGRLPYRNIDGAILDAPGVVFAQSTDDRPIAAEAIGAMAAEQAMTLLDRPAGSVSVPPRIGAPA
jgi:thioredoxin reductase